MDSIDIKTTTTISKHYGYKGYIAVARELYALDHTYVPSTSLYKIKLNYQYTDTKSYVLESSEWSITYKVFNNNTLIAAQTTTFVWPDAALELNPNTTHELYNIPLTLPNDGKRYNVQLIVAHKTGVPSFNINAEFNTALMTIGSVAGCSFLLSDFTNKHLKAGWTETPNAYCYSAVLYRIDHITNVTEPIKSLVVFDATTAEVTENDKEVWSKLYPGDKVYWGVTPITNTGVRSYEVTSDWVVYGDTAHIKKDNAWTNMIPYVKVNKKFKPVKTVWIKVDGTWVRAIDN